MGVKHLCNNQKVVGWWAKPLMLQFVQRCTPSTTINSEASEHLSTFQGPYSVWHNVVCCVVKHCPLKNH